MGYLIRLSRKHASTLGLALAGCLLAQTQASAALSPKATEIWSIFGLPVTNSMITSWIFSILLILLIRALVKRPKLAPTKGQYMVGDAGWGYTEHH